MHPVAGFILTLLLAMKVMADSGYIITAPKAMVAGSVEKVCVTLIGVEEDVLITLTLSRDGDEAEPIVSKEYTVNYLDTCLSLEIPDGLDVTEAKLSVSGLGLAPRSKFRFTDEKGVYLQSRKPETFIQTDKPIYKPGQTVRFRILTIKGTEFKPYPAMFSLVWIENPSGVRLMQWYNVTSQDGLVELELPLSEEPVLGTWKIITQTEDFGTEQTFDVDEYVLPKFEVIINPPPFIIVNDKTIEVEVCGRYTYGQPVRGEVQATICIEGYSYYYDRTRPCVEKYLQDTGPDGCAQFVVNATELELMSSDYSIWSSKLKVDAQLTEANTGVTLSGVHEAARIYTAPFQLEIQAPDYFKPGVPFYGKVKVTNPDGSPASGKLVNLVVNTNDGDILNKNFTSVNGEFDFELTNVAITTGSMYIRAVGPGFTEPYNYEIHQHVYRVFDPYTSKSLKPWYSPSGSFLQIEPVKQTLQVDSEHAFTFYYTTDEERLVDLYVKMVANGDIVHSDHQLLELIPEFERRQPTTPKKPPTAAPTEAPERPVTTEETQTGDESDESDEEVDGLGEIRIPEYDWWPWQPEIIEPTVEIEDPGAYGVVTVSLPIAREMGPNCKLLIYYIRADGEVVADSIKIKVQKKFKNEVNLRFAVDETLPGVETQLELTAAPGSLCAIGVVDKSVHLMKSSNQLTPGQVFNTLNMYDLSNVYGTVDRSTHCDRKDEDFDDDDSGPFPRGEFRKKRSIAPYWYGGYSKYADALTAFQDSGVIVLTDQLLETRPCQRRHPWRYRIASMARGEAGLPGAPGPEQEMVDMDVAEPEFFAPDEPQVEDGAAEDFSPLVEIRTYFPETWLWKLERISDDGSLSMGVEVPHTITEWIGSGFCTSAEQGVGVSETTTLTAFQPFFLSYTLPYSVIRGENVPVLVTVFNYLSQCLTIDLTMELSNDFDYLEDSPVKTVCVCGGESTTISFRIVPVVLGEIPITVQAESVAANDVTEICGNDAVMSDKIGARDGLSQPLLVEPEGIEEEHTFSSFFCPQDEQDYTYTEEVELNLPSNVVEGSARATLSVIGDVMGPTLAGLDKLLTVPYGCGEQNMVSFTPNIFVLQYLTQTYQATEDIKERALANMRRGYQRELTYRHSDGSYSAFGERDPEGSTWLTAFVVKSFAQSEEFISIDEKDLAISIEWFRKQQNEETGCFIKRGSVHNKRLKGGVSDETSLTAFVLIAMLEAGIPKEDFSVQSALQCLERRLDNVTAPYTTAIVSYAFALANSPLKDYMLEKLDNVAIRSADGLVYWAASEEEEEEEPPYWRWYYQAPSANVEMTSYAMLAQLVDSELRADVITDLLPTIRWLTQQRNAYGGFASTQDTVLALQALAIYAGRMYQSGIDLYTDFQSTSLVQRFEVNRLNKLVLQRVDVPVLPTTVYIRAGGIGCALMQANLKYNMPESPAPPSFDLDINILPAFLADDAGENTGCSGDRVVNICTRYTGEDESSNMAVVEVKMVSGYYPDKSSLKDALKATDIMARFDVDGNKVIFYFDEIGHENLCFTFYLEHLIEVEDVKPGWVSVYDYYDKDTSTIKTYDVCAQQSTGKNPDNSDACPKCLSTIPDNFGERLCDKEVFKAKNHGSKGFIKMMENFSFNLDQDQWGEGLDRILKPVVPDGCSCKLLDAESAEKFLVVSDPAQIMLPPITPEEQIATNGGTYFITWDRSFRKDIEKAYDSCKRE